MTLRATALLVALLAVAGCQREPIVPTTAAPPACGLADFALAGGVTLPAPKTRQPADGKSRPLSYADSLPVRAGVGINGKWSAAAPGWQAWRLWIRSEDARSLAIRVSPLRLPPHATLWICSPDRTTRRAFDARSGGGRTEYWSPSVPGPELWVELQVPAGTEPEAQLVIAEAFAAFD